MELKKPISRKCLKDIKMKIVLVKKKGGVVSKN